MIGHAPSSPSSRGGGLVVRRGWAETVPSVSQLLLQRACLGQVCGLTEGIFHLATDPDRRVVRIVFDVAPFETLALGDIVLQLDLMRQPERQISLLQRSVGRRLLAPDTEAAFAVQDLSGGELALGGGHPGAAPPTRRRCRVRGRSYGWAGRATRICRSCRATCCIP